MEVLIRNLYCISWQQLVMWGVGGLLIYLAIAKEMEPALLIMGTGMLGIFLVTGVIIGVVSLLNKLADSK